MCEDRGNEKYLYFLLNFTMNPACSKEIKCTRKKKKNKANCFSKGEKIQFSVLFYKITILPKKLSIRMMDIHSPNAALEGEE